MPAPLEAFATVVGNVYPGIAPQKFAGIHKGKVVLITGGGTGLGLAAAKAFAQTGASVFLTGRRVDTLEIARGEIEALGGVADFVQMDVTDTESVASGVNKAVKRFGKIDIVIANAGGGHAMGKKLADFDVNDWWSCVEGHLKGAFLTAHATLPHLAASKGYIILVSSRGAQTRIPSYSGYCMSKHAVNRLAEWIDIEYSAQGVKSFAVHPGSVVTPLTQKAIDLIPSLKEIHTDSADLSAWTYVRLTSGSEDWLSGRYVDATASLDEINNWKERIVEQDALKNRLALPI